MLACGLLRLGRVVTYIPWPVVEGFTLGIAAIIFLQQVPAAVGIAAETGHNTLVTAVRSVGTALRRRAHAAAGRGRGARRRRRATWVWTLAIVAVVAAVMLVLPRVARALPALLVAVALGSVLAELSGAPVPRIGELPSSLPFPVLPDATPDAVRDLVGAAVAIAALAAIESLLLARVAAAMPTDRTAELAGDGPAIGLPTARARAPARAAPGPTTRTGFSRAGARVARERPVRRHPRNGRDRAHRGQRALRGPHRLAAVVHALVILAVIYLATGPVGRSRWPRWRAC